jgi:hypothetical protein
MPKSDDTRYASEIPMLHAWDSDYVNNDVIKAQKIALASKYNEYYANSEKSLRHKQIIESDMAVRGFKSVKDIFWQSNYNRNNNGSPADIVFVDHEIGGVSVKDGSDIIGNFGTKDFDTDIDRPRGEDLFRHLAQEEYDCLVLKVKTALLAQLNVGQTWTVNRDYGYGKYAITRNVNNTYTLKFDTKSMTLTMDEILTGIIIKKEKTKKISTKWFRVFGDFYQENKKDYKQERDALFNKLYPIIESLCKRIIISDPLKICKIGGFSEKPYYVSDLHKDRIYFVQSDKSVVNNIELVIFNKDKDRSFGSGFELGCKIKLIDSSEFAKLDFYVCYNSGTFTRGPVIKIQGFQDKEKLWQRIA